MTFTDAIAAGFRKYVTFSGRAARSEYWYWVLFVVLLSIVSGIVDASLFAEADMQPVGAIAGILTFLPGISVSVRRLHDIDRTGWWVLIAFTIVGIVLLIYWDCVKGTTGPNRYGPDPLA